LEKLSAIVRQRRGGVSGEFGVVGDVAGVGAAVEQVVDQLEKVVLPYHLSVPTQLAGRSAPGGASLPPSMPMSDEVVLRDAARADTTATRIVLRAPGARSSEPALAQSQRPA